MDALILLSLSLVSAPADEAQAKSYNRAGVTINDALHELSVATGGPPAAEAVGLPPLVLLSERQVGPARVRRYAASKSIAVRSVLEAIRASYAEVDDWKLKLVSLSLDDETSATAKIRFEATGLGRDGQRRTDRLNLNSWWRRPTPGAPLELTNGALSAGGVRVSGPGNLFAEEAEIRGLRFQGEPDPRFAPPSDALRFQIIRHAIGGASAADVDGDGDDDLFLTGGGAAVLFINDGTGRFTDGTAAAGLAGIEHANAALFADFDNDGDADLFVGRFFGPNLLFENRDGVYVDVTAGSGLAPDDMTAVLSAADFDGDGVLDLYIGRFLDARTDIPQMIHYSRNGAANRLYLGSGDLKFRDVSAASGADDVGLTLGIAAADYDDDGDVDLYLANDFGRNVMLRNRGDATFEDVAQSTGTLAVSAGMSASFGDPNGDGRADLYVSSVRSNQRWFSNDVNIGGYVLELVKSERRAKLQDLFLDLRRHLGDRWRDIGQLALAGNYLLTQRDDGGFDDVSDKTSVRPYGWYWSSGFFDVDMDGDEDILALNGWITGPDEHDL